MGSLFSSRKPVADLQLMKGFAAQPASVQGFFQDKVDGLLALGVSINVLEQRIDDTFMGKLTPQELATFTELSWKKDCIIAGVDKFLKTEKIRYGSVVQELGLIESGSNLGSLLRNSQPAAQVATIDQLVTQLDGATKEWKEFHITLKAAMDRDGRSTRAGRIFLGSLFAVGAAAAVAFIAIAFSHVTSIDLSVEKIAILAAAAAALTTLAIKCFSQDEVQRALKFISKIKDGLYELRKEVVQLSSLETVLADEWSKEVWRTLVVNTLGHIERTLVVTDKAARNSM